ncbi:MAG: sugar phosphatase [Pantoea eucrina]|jgi:Cof subfamily protein (haloacid dehalogenase superfamily)|uniref:Cof-type HAD-IIB family hydrolase n=1 Tax=Pantoea sp. SIMBA_079 TaxID=3085817 RepID=UPI0026EC8FE1|nr:Cof-type HAD-IIB family hydrolase [uncultured Pantoea sp.]MDF2783974.1 sugar phosphatase [Pantoea eucrina]
MAAVKMVAVDMDGTFLDDRKQYDRPRFMACYQMMKQRGIRFVVASGNQYYQLKSFFPDIAHEIAFVAENGAWILDGEEELFCGAFSPDAVHAVLDTLQQGNYPGLRFLICGRNSAYYFAGADAQWLQKMQHYCHRLRPIETLDEIAGDRLFKFALNLSDEYVPVLMADIERLHQGSAAATSSGHGSVDLIVPGLHKANGLRLLQQRWGIESSEVLAFGDGGNDLEMLAQSGFSFAMQNAPERVKAAARYGAADNNHAGVLQVIEQMLAGDGPFA